MGHPLQVLDEEILDAGRKARSAEGDKPARAAADPGVDVRARGWGSRLQAFWRVRDVHLRGVDVVILVSCSLAALALVGPARWAPGSTRAAAHFAFFALGPLVLRTLEASFPRNRLLSFVASFWLLPVLGLSHEFLAPLVNAITPVLRDAQLAAAEQQLLGVKASVALGHLVPPWLTEVLMLCYYGHFIWPVALGVVLYFTGRRDAFDEYLLALSLLFSFNYFSYALVPAVGPRYFLLDAFSEPLKGLWLTPLLDSAMRAPPFAKDCFPSGHTGTTLVVLAYAFRFERRVFRAMLLPGIGLIVATLVGRFHYTTDLLCALPLVLVVLGLARCWSRAAARFETVTRPVSDSTYAPEPWGAPLPSPTSTGPRR
ncbi:phosphatase PAP2 family protein [Vitiosangium sp. GDMCC 1.1324]|uniref:phosphatase PAP2 family protein n=1 Tax=Vitiosangium sp. (strain GDMCC 1.1324) TaxID=2138576 RepID=UPI000D37F1B8|nr:phosphatase PAP2 family protein [Vitiosangium sp. GDMCC 1.1324]PTL83527.1 phosphatidic acid phosphatase [Vitiosangium sp. GDMCC 1.1324]